MTIARARRPHAAATAPDERDLHIAFLLGVTPDRVRTMRRVHAKCAAGDQVDTDAARRRVGLGPTAYDCWRRLEGLDEGELHDEVARRRPGRSRSTAVRTVGRRT